MGPYGWIWMIVWIAVLIVMVWLIVRGPAERTAAEDAMAILRARFARGEISQDEFERARNALLVDQAQTREGLQR
jgi:putative membrane protein